MKNLDGKVAIVAGGGRDIGRAVSVKLAAEGAKVVVNYYNDETQATETHAAIEAVGGEAILVGGDMTNQADVDRLIAETKAAYGESVDILVNVVGGLVARKTLSEMDADFFELLMKLNVTSTFMMTRAVTDDEQWCFHYQFCFTGRPRWRWPGRICLRYSQGRGNDFYPCHGQRAWSTEYTGERPVPRHDFYNLPRHLHQGCRAC